MQLLFIFLTNGLISPDSVIVHHRHQEAHTLNVKVNHQNLASIFKDYKVSQGLRSQLLYLNYHLFIANFMKALKNIFKLDRLA